MLDISAINIKSLSEEETDLWCSKILEYSIEDESNLSDSYLLNLFRFTRSLLNVKHIQTEVLLEELQNVEQKLEDSSNELDNYKNKSETENDLRKKLEEQEQTLGNINQQRKELISELQEKNKELIEIKSQFKNDSRLDFDQYNNSNKIKNQLKEKNEQIEQLLDKLYDSDRINLELAEQVAKLRVDLAKFDNDNQLLNARCQMLEKQNKELEVFNENLMNEKLSQAKEINKIDKINQRNDKDENNYFNHLEKELQRLKTLIEVKNLEISELRELNSNVSNNYQMVEKLEGKNDQIERLEEELRILSENFVHQLKMSPDNEESKLEIKPQKHSRQICKLKKQIKLLKLRNEELNKETHKKDEELIKQRKYISLLIGGDDKMKKLLEENLVFNQMVRSRDNKIKLLIGELNKQQMVSEQYHTSVSEQSDSEKDLCVEQEIQLGDQIIALTVDRDILTKQVDAFKTHLESIYHENLELQMGMKEILEGIKQSDATTDIVLECPSLERVCRLLENRSVYFGLNCFDSNNDSNGANITQIILLKSELDHVRGQNEQLRNEMKNLRTDFLSMIDEYTNDILNNWTITTHEIFNENNDVLLSKTHNEEEEEEIVVDNDEDDVDDDDNDNDDVDSLASSEYSIESGIKITEGLKSRPRSRIQRIYASTKTETKDVSTITLQVEMIDIGLDPIQQVLVSADDNNLKIKDFVNQWTQTTDIEISSNKLAPNRVVETESKLNEMIVDQQLNEKQTNLEILLQDKEVQAIPIIYTKSVQTDFEPAPNTELHCAKYNSMLNSIRKLISKEREHYRLQENKLVETIELLNEKLKLVKKEYQIDIDAKNEEIQDLRSKMIKLTSSIKNSISCNLTEMQPTRPKNSEIFDDDLIQIKHDETKSKSVESPNKIIFETIVECLQKCLKQKDEALEEYRLIIENIRSSNYLSTSQPPIEAGTFLDITKNISNDSENRNNNNETNQPIHMERIYEELFIKPKIQENNQLMELLRSTLHQLESVRTKSRERVKQLEMELDMKCRQIIELTSKNNKLTEQQNSSRMQIQSMEAQFKTQDEKIETLKVKLNEMTKKNQQSIQTATALKKKVDNSVFQESADLRSKISELESEVRRLEVEKWNIDKRLNQERQLSKERLTEREQNIEKLSNQVLNLQSLLSKMEKKLAKKTQQTAINSKPKETKNKCTQTEEINLVKIRTNNNDNENTTDKMNKLKDQTKIVTKNLKAKKQEFLGNGPMHSVAEQENIQLSTDMDMDNISKEVVQTNDKQQKNWQDEDQNGQIDLSRHIIIDAFRLEQMSTEINEIPVVGNETIAHMEKKPQALSINPCSNKKQQSISKESSCSSNSTCLECESKFSTHRIEQHLIDLRLERLLDENIKYDLGSVGIALTKKK